MQVSVASELEESHEKLEIPWKAADPTSGYFDLRANPRELDRVEQARRHHPLRNFLATVNSADSIFSTVWCRTWLNREDASGVAGTEPYEFASSIALIYAREDFNFELGHCEDLAQRLAQLLTRETTREAMRVELRVRRCRFCVREQWGFCLTIFLYARGATPEQAELRWGLGLARLQQALLFLSRVIRHEPTQTS